MSRGVVLTEAEREAIRIAISTDLVPVVPTPSAEWIGWWLTQDRPRKTPGVIERLITARLAAQAGRVAEVVKKVWGEFASYRCDRCLLPRPTDEDWDTIEPGQGAHLCWAEWSSTCDGPAGDMGKFLAARVAAELEADQ